MFYSKRITDPRIAAKITGKQDRYTIGAIGAVNKEEQRDGRLGAVRVSRDVLKYSSVAAMVSGYDHADFSNFNYGINANFRPSQIFSLFGKMQSSYNSDMNNTENMLKSIYSKYAPDEGFRAVFSAQQIGKYYEPRAGIYGARDIQSFRFEPGYSIRLNEIGIKQLRLFADAEKKESSTGTPLGYNIKPFIIALTSMKDFGIGGNIGFGEEKVQLRQNSELMWSDEFYNIRKYQFYFGYMGNRYWDFDTGFIWGRKPVYSSDFSEAFEGKNFLYDFILGAKPVSNINIKYRFHYAMEKKRSNNETTFSGTISSLGVDYQITRHIHFNNIVEFDSNEERLRFETVLGYELGMGNKILLSYKSRGHAEIHKLSYPNDEMTISLKASYLFRI
ncbi:hypothetical protein ACFL6P_08120 [Candidatus Latescibacterota bacterium]